MHPLDDLEENIISPSYLMGLAFMSILLHGWCPSMCPSHVLPNRPARVELDRPHPRPKR
jgi:hypothetical protein